ncbi:MAG: NAD+ synthase [Thermoplasmatales archaeon]|nr:NAD+ synthase [Thermoplasmatales archaeon]MCW6170953.1 NAD+ synthase [Thermoplasmatales archaeon]
MDAEQEIQRITKFLREFVGSRNAIVGLSGGIDSSVTLMLLKKSIPHFKIFPFFMPSDTTPRSDYDDVYDLASIANVNLTTIDITPIFVQFQKSLGASDISALGNIKARIRMSILYYFSNIHDGVVIGTTNKTENYLGYFTKFGDGACDVEPIIHLLKRDVKQLGESLGVPQNIINKKPSAGLWEHQSDEDELGMTYDQMDQSVENLFMKHRDPVSEVDRKVLELYQKTKHKRNFPVSLEEEK